MTFAELCADTKRGLREASGSGVYFGDGDISEAVNAGYAELSDASEWHEATQVLTLLEQRPYYDLFTILGHGFLSLKPVFDEATSRWLHPSTVRGLDQHDRRWERVSGRPQRAFLRGVRWLGLWPRTNADGTTLTLHFTSLPTPLDADADEPGFPDAYHVGCVHFALADLFAQDGETRLALRAWADYLAIEAQLTAWVDGRLQRPRVRVLGGQA